MIRTVPFRCTARLRSPRRAEQASELVGCCVRRGSSRRGAQRARRGGRERLDHAAAAGAHAAPRRRRTCPAGARRGRPRLPAGRPSLSGPSCTRAWKHERQTPRSRLPPAGGVPRGRARASTASRCRARSPSRSQHGAARSVFAVQSAEAGFFFPSVPRAADRPSPRAAAQGTSRLASSHGRKLQTPFFFTPPSTVAGGCAPPGQRPRCHGPVAPRSAPRAVRRIAGATTGLGGWGCGGAGGNPTGRAGAAVLRMPQTFRMPGC